MNVVNLDQIRFSDPAAGDLAVSAKSVDQIGVIRVVAERPQYEIVDVLIGDLDELTVKFGV